MRGRVKNIALCLGVALIPLMSFGQGGSARDRGHDRSISFEQRENLQEIQRLLEGAMDAARDWSFTYARYKFKAVELRAQDLTPSVGKSQLVEAVKTAQIKLSDWRLSSREKSDIAIDCARVAREAADRLMRLDDGPAVEPGLVGSLKLMEAVVRLARTYRFESAFGILDRIQLRLKDYRFDRDIESAREAVEVIQDKLADPRLSNYERLDVVEDCARAFESAVLRSDTYRSELRGGDEIDYSQAIFMPIGQTDLFSRSKIETRLVLVPSAITSIRALRLTARDDYVAVRSLTLILQNGGRMDINVDASLAENSSTIVEISLGHLRLKSIEVTATSANIFGTKGRIQLEGVTFAGSVRESRR